MAATRLGVEEEAAHCFIRIDGMRGFYHEYHCHLMEAIR